MKDSAKENDNIFEISPNDDLVEIRLYDHALYLVECSDTLLYNYKDTISFD